MGLSGQGYVLVPSVIAFRDGLPPDEAEAFRESVARIVLDPKGSRTGARRRIRPPLVYYVYRDSHFVMFYALWKRPNDTRERVEIFFANHTDVYEQGLQSP